MAHLLRLADTLRQRLADAGLADTATLEMRALPGIATAGPVTLDTAAWTELARSAAAERNRLAAAMDALPPTRTACPGSPPGTGTVLAAVLAAFHAVGVTLTATSDDTLATIERPLAEYLRGYRSAAKKADTYGASWLTKHAPTGTVLPSWKQLGAESGRMSCTGPGLQQIPRAAEYRRCFTARPGHVLVKADYPQIELRIAAKLANEPAMIAAYAVGDDLHTLTAANITGKPVDQVSKSDRQLAKAVNFGLLYGMGWRRLKEYAQNDYGVTLTDTQAKRYRTAFFRAYPGLRRWHDRTEMALSQQIRKDPAALFETRTLGGRRRLTPAAKRDAKGQPYPNKTEALNTPVQGTGADGLKAAIALV